MMQITEAVKHLLIINILLFIGTITLMEENRYVLALFFPSSEYFRPWQIVTHMFMHGSINHLFFNMLSLFFLGPFIENYLGTKRFVVFYFICGFGGAFLHLLIKYFQIYYGGELESLNIPMLGASAAITGLFIALAYLFPDLELYMMFIPIPIKAKYLAIIAIISDLAFGLTGYATGIAHFAHLGGALFGFLYIFVLQKSK
ncbi:MAG: rhomboid family intramembrane serine protease [Bacteroidota bacterium]|nr:rhomboid family intramembrane serine protease [Bacteroidota bacterium]